MTTAPTARPSADDVHVRPAPVARRAAVVAVVAAVTNLVVYVVARLADASLEVPASPGSEELQDLPVGAVVAASVVAVGLAAVALLAAARWVPPSVRWFPAVVVVLTVLSLGAVAGVDDGGTVVALAAMHLLTGALVAVGLPADGAVGSRSRR